TRRLLQESDAYHDAPAAFHMTEALLLDAEHDWFEGVDKGQGAENLKADLARLEKRRVSPPPADAPSLGALTAQGRKPDAKALETARAGERASGDPEAGHVRNLLDAAAQHRYEGETLLLACRGYASTEEADRELEEAGKLYDICKRSLDAARRAGKILDRARA